MDATQRSARPVSSNTDPPSAASLIHQGQRLAHDATALVDNASNAVSGVRNWATHTVATRPWTVVGIAGATGYILAGGLAAPFTRWMVRTAGRVLAARLVQAIYTSWDAPRED